MNYLDIIIINYFLSMLWILSNHIVKRVECNAWDDFIKKMAIERYERKEQRSASRIGRTETSLLVKQERIRAIRVFKLIRTAVAMFVLG